MSCCPFPSGASAEDLTTGTTRGGEDILRVLLLLPPLFIFARLVLFSPPAAEGAAKKTPDRKPRLLDLMRPGNVVVGAAAEGEDEDVEDARLGMARGCAGPPAAGTEEEEEEEETEEEEEEEEEEDLLMKNCKSGEGGGDGDEGSGLLLVLRALLGSAMGLCGGGLCGIRLYKSYAMNVETWCFWIALSPGEELLQEQAGNRRWLEWELEFPLDK